MRYNAEEINVVYCSSDLFSEVCAVSIVSLFENNRNIKSINVFIVDDCISEKNRQRLTGMAESYGRNIVFIPLPDPSEFYNDSRFTVRTLGHTYARMILGDIIPESVERIISLDSDTMVLSSIDEYYS